MVSFALVVGSVLVLVGPRCGGFVCPNVGSRLVFVCVRRRSVAARAEVYFLRVVGWCLLVVVLRVSHWFRLSCMRGGFVSFVSLFGAACWSAHAKIGKFAL